MNKKEFIASVSEKTGQSAADVDAVLKSIIDTIVEVGSAEDKIVLPGLGTFEGKMREERQGRNPATGEALTVPAKKVLKFKASTALTL